MQLAGSSDVNLRSNKWVNLQTDVDGTNGGGNGEFQFRTTSDDNITLITTTGDNWQGFELRTAMESHNNEAGSKDTELRGEDDLILSAQNAGCVIVDNTGGLNCDGSKNWVHNLNTTYEAVYSAQESPAVRAVVEDTATVTGGDTTVRLPTHFTQTVSPERPDMTVQVTPHELATTAVTDRNRTHVTIAADTDVQVDYRVTGIREGYENKDAVRWRADPLA